MEGQVRECTPTSCTQGSDGHKDTDGTNGMWLAPPAKGYEFFVMKRQPENGKEQRPDERIGSCVCYAGAMLEPLQETGPAS